MNNTLKYALIFAGGMAAGLICSMAVNRGVLNMKPVAAGLISRGMDVKDAISNCIEKTKEDVQDLIAEAKADQMHRKEQKA